MRAGIAFRNAGKLGPYEDALRAVGIEPVRISLDAPPPIGSLDGLVLAGGADINPARYGQQPAPQTDPPDDQRDEVETRLLQDALQYGVPVLAICRGMQLFNVVHGGTLIQHLPTDSGHQSKQLEAHDVRVVAETRLASIVGEGDHTVNSRHHQAAGRVGTSLIVSAMSPDGVIEALEKPGDSFAIAVQWHPEDRILVSASDRNLFEAFAKALRPAPAAHP